MAPYRHTSLRALEKGAHRDVSKHASPPPSATHSQSRALCSPLLTCNLVQERKVWHLPVFLLVGGSQCEGPSVGPSILHPFSSLSGLESGFHSGSLEVDLASVSGADRTKSPEGIRGSTTTRSFFFFFWKASRTDHKNQTRTQKCRDHPLLADCGQNNEIATDSGCVQTPSAMIQINLY